jgi:hypothetical protein
LIRVEAQSRPPAGKPTPAPTTNPTQSPSPSSAPPNAASACPQVSVQALGNRNVRDGQPVSFTASITGGDPKISPLIVWNVTAGSIKEGQGTRKVEVDTTGSGTASDRQIAAEVWVGGYASDCGSPQATAIVKIIPPAAKFGEFGELSQESLAKNLKALAEFLSQSEDNLYLIGYAGRKSERGFAATSIRKMKEMLATEGIAARRIVAVDGGFREEPLFDFWIVPTGAEPPRPEPTVNRNEIVYPRTTPPKRP